MVNPFLLLKTVQLKVKESPGQVGEAVMNCPLTSPAYVDRNTVTKLLFQTIILWLPHRACIHQTQLFYMMFKVVKQG